MTTAVIFWDDSGGAVEGEVPAVRPVADFWRADLQAFGVEVLDTVVQCSKLVHSVQHHAPDVVVCHVAQASESLLDVFEALSTHYERSMQMLMGWRKP